MNLSHVFEMFCFIFASRVFHPKRSFRFLHPSSSLSSTSSASSFTSSFYIANILYVALSSETSGSDSGPPLVFQVPSSVFFLFVFSFSIGVV